MSMMQGESDLVESREVMIRRGGAGRLGGAQRARMREAGVEAGTLSSLQLPTHNPPQLGHDGLNLTTGGISHSDGGLNTRENE